MWCQRTTHYRPRIAVAIFAFLVLLVALFTTAIVSVDASANTSPARTLNFQGRLLRATGAVVPDGHYNIQFKIYEGGSGTAANNPDGTLKWTENYVNDNANNGVRVKNGLFSVNLGAVTPFGDTIDWNADAIWLSMNVAGSASDCATFGADPCAADGEMLPMKQMTATPFAMNAGQLGGKTADNFLHLAQGVQTDPSNSTSIALNKTGSGDFVRLQKDGDEVFAISPNGNIRLGGIDDKTISMEPAQPGQSGANLTLSAGSGGTGDTNGGNLLLSGGAGSGMGAPGLIVMNTPTFQTSMDDANCFTDGDIVGDTCTFTTASVNSSAVLMTGFSEPEQTATVPDPTISTAGRILYITAVGHSEPFDLRINPASSGEQTIHMRPNMSLTLLWNGVDWTVASALIEVPSFTDMSVNGGGEIAGASEFEFMEYSWWESDTSLMRNTDPAFVASGKASVSVTGRQASNTGLAGSYNQLRAALQPNTAYTVSLLAYLESGTPHTLGVGYISDMNYFEGSFCNGDGLTLSQGEWVHFTCSFITPPEGTTRSNTIAILEVGGVSDYVYYIDDLSVTASLEPGEYIPIEDTEWQTDNLMEAMSLPKSAVVDNNTPQSRTSDAPGEDLLGSMYYDEKLGKVQCYEAEGWGSCGAAPDTFVSLSPAYPGVVVDESNTNSATFSTGFCSGSLGINTEGDTPVCGEGETYNYYQLSNSSATSQSSTNTLYVTYALPDNFKEFVPNTTSLTAKTLLDGSETRYQIYKNTDGELTPCGDMVVATSGTSQSWQRSQANGTSDPADCGFAAGDSVLFKIELSLPPKPSAESTAAAYVSDINLVFRND